MIGMVPIYIHKIPNPYHSCYRVSRDSFALTVISRYNACIQYINISNLFDTYNLDGMNILGSLDDEIITKCYPGSSLDNLIFTISNDLDEVNGMYAIPNVIPYLFRDLTFKDSCELFTMIGVIQKVANLLP